MSDSQILKASRYFLSQAKSAADAGIWRTTEDGSKIFITGAGEVRAGGPGGKVIGGKPEPAAKKPEAKKPATKKPTAEKPVEKKATKKETAKTAQIALAEARTDSSINIEQVKASGKITDTGIILVFSDRTYLRSQKYKQDTDFVNEKSEDVSDVRSKLTKTNEADFDKVRKELIDAIGKRSKKKAVELSVPEGDGNVPRRAKMAAEFLDSVYSPKKPIEVKVESRQGRSNAVLATNTIKMDPEKLVGTYVHEIGHLLEKNKGNLRAARAMLFSLTKTGQTAALSSRGYGEHEVTHGEIPGVGDLQGGSRHTAFYAGKTYGSQATEIISVGLQQLHDNPKKMARENPKYFDFMVNVLRGNYEE
jgi:hypothetical protein